MGQASTKKGRAYKELERKYVEQLDLNKQALGEIERVKRNYNSILALLLGLCNEHGTVRISKDGQNYDREFTLDIRMDADEAVVLSLKRPTVQPVTDDGRSDNESSGEQSG